MTLPLNRKELRKSNTLISGTNQVGKSRCAMQICDKLKDTWQIVVFDNCGIWKEKSSIQTYYQVSEATLSYVLPKKGESIIYDISLLLPSFQREFVEYVLHDLWKNRVRNKPLKWLLIVFEEFQLYGQNTRGLVSQNILRIMSVGANHKIRILGISPDLSLIDCAFIRLTNQRYHFKLGNEPNAKTRFNKYYGKDNTQVCLNLDVGYCLYYLLGKIKVYKIPLFISKTTSKPYMEPQKPKPISLKARILNAIYGNTSKEQTEPQHDTSYGLDTEEQEDDEFVEELDTSFDEGEFTPI